MVGRSLNRPLNVVIDARLVSGQTGGVESVLAGLAHGLSSLGDSHERYTFVCWRGHEGWLAPHVGGRGDLRLVEPPDPELVPSPLTLRQRLGARFPELRRMWREGRFLGKARMATDSGLPIGDTDVASLNPDVVHFPFQRGFLTDVPTIFQPHDLQHVHLPEFFTDEERARRERWYGALARQATMVAVASQWTKRDVESHYHLDPDVVRVIPLAPPTAAVAPASAATIAATRRRYALPQRFLLYPAQTWPHKNHASLLKAAAALRDSQNLQIDLVFPGMQNHYAAELRSVAEGLGLTEHVHWLGFVSPEEIQALYSTAHAVVVPSRFEAASAPLWEAFRAGVPAACSRVTSLPEQAGDAAVLFDPMNVEEIARAIVKIWLDDEARRDLIAAGRRQVASYSWERTARIFRAHYRRIGGQTMNREDGELVRAPTAF